MNAKIIKDLPHLPGVYVYYNSIGEVIYVGKAKNLHKRVSSYFNRTVDHKTSLLVTQIAKLEYHVTPTEIDALILENQLILQHQPRYNILLKTESSFRYICISKTNPPQISMGRKPSTKQLCFGPFPFAVHSIIKVARDLLGLTKHQQLAHFNWQLYLDAANLRKPSKQQLDPEVYAQFITKLTNTIKYGDQTLIQEYQARMQKHAKNLEFEQAQQYKQKIELLQKMTQRTGSHQANLEQAEHLIVALPYQQQSLIFIFKIKYGLLEQIQKFSFKAPLSSQTPGHGDLLDGDLINQILKQYYTQHPAPTKISLQSSLSATVLDPAIASYLSQLWQHPVQIKLVQKHRLLKLAQQNIYAKLNFKNQLGLELQRQFNLPITPSSVDLIDISNLGASVVVGGAIRFVNGAPVKGLWRHYNIKTVIGQNDFASITEVVARRYSKIPLPDLLIIDGGLGQLHAAQAGLPPHSKVITAGLAKAEETLIFDQDHQFKLTSHTIAGKFMIGGRDAVHNFVIQHSRQKFRKIYQKSFLDQIPGIGSTTKLKLLKHFGSVEQIRQASLNELTQVIGPSKAKLIIQSSQTPA